MKRTAIEFLILVALFFSTWFGLSRVNWMAILKIEKATKSTEEKLGEIFWKQFSKTEEEIAEKAVRDSVSALVDRICKYNDIDRSSIKVHVLRKDEVNAFALPDDHLVVYSGLLAACEDETELLGVLGHEIAHMEKNHVMKKLIKEVGLSVLISMTTGNGGGEVIKETAKLLSSRAYDRDLEREADQTSVDYLLKAKIDPEPFADFLYRLSDETGSLPEQLSWISTHPDSKERAEQIIAYINDKAVAEK
jgi:beta-barrel assembly-enhancing protease